MCDLTDLLPCGVVKVLLLDGPSPPPVKDTTVTVYSEYGIPTTVGWNWSPVTVAD